MSVSKHSFFEDVLLSSGLGDSCSFYIVSMLYLLCKDLLFVSVKNVPFWKLVKNALGVQLTYLSPSRGEFRVQSNPVFSCLLFSKKISIVDVCLGSEYVSAFLRYIPGKIITPWNEIKDSNGLSLKILSVA